MAMYVTFFPEKAVDFRFFFVSLCHNFLNKH